MSRARSKFHRRLGSRDCRQVTADSRGITDRIDKYRSPEWMRAKIAPVIQPGQPGVDRQRDRAVACSCGWVGAVRDLRNLSERGPFGGVSAGFPVCPSCRGKRGELRFS